MKKLLYVVAIIAIMGTVMGAAMADSTKSPNHPRVRPPSVSGTIKAVNNDKDGKLVSFVITTPGRHGKDVTVNVDSKTKYILITAAVGEKLVPGKNITKSDPMSVENNIGKRAYALFKADDTTKTGPATSVRVRVPPTK